MIIKLQDLSNYFTDSFKQGFPDCKFIILGPNSALLAGQSPNVSSVNLFKSDFHSIDISTIVIEHDGLIYKIIDFHTNIIGIVPL